MFYLVKVLQIPLFIYVSSCMSNYNSKGYKFIATFPDGMTAHEVMLIFGVKGEDSFTSQEIRGMSRPFKYSDLNSDGYLTEDEYVGASKHFKKNPRGARGLLRASDNNRDGKVSYEEYIQNRIIRRSQRHI